MARGWESKSVESQMEAAEPERVARDGTPLTEAEVLAQREVDMLQLSRTRVLRDIESAKNPRYRAQLEAALEHLDRQLDEKGVRRKA